MYEFYAVDKLTVWKNKDGIFIYWKKKEKHSQCCLVEVASYGGKAKSFGVSLISWFYFSVNKATQ